MDGTDDRLLEGAVLVVAEAHAESRRMLATMLRTAGAEVHAAATAEEALRLAHEVRPRALLVDLRLPDASGLTLVEWVKSDAETDGIVCIAVTSENGPAIERAARTAGCAACVRRPVDALTFPALLAQLLGGPR